MTSATLVSINPECQQWCSSVFVWRPRVTIILYRSLLFIYLSFLYYSSESSCTFTPLNVRLDLGLVISFCVTASSDNYSIQDFSTYPLPRLTLTPVTQTSNNFVFKSPWLWLNANLTKPNTTSCRVCLYIWERVCTNIMGCNKILYRINLFPLSSWIYV